MKTLAGIALVLAFAAPVMAQVTCVRLDMAFSCADGTSPAIYDDPWRGARGRASIGLGEPGLERGGGGWWKDESSVHGPRGEVCLLHGNHVHCNGTLTDVPVGAVKGADTYLSAIDYNIRTLTEALR